MKMLSAIFVSLAIRAVLIGTLSAAIVKLPASASLKVFIVLLLILAYLLLKEISAKLDQVCRNQGNLLYFLRNTYIAVEMNRLEPDNRIPSQDLLKNDLKTENEDKAVYEEMQKEALSGFGGLIYHGGRLVFFVFFLVIAVIVCVLLLSVWPVIEQIIA